MTPSQTNTAQHSDFNTKQMVNEVRENVLITINVVLERLKSPSIDQATSNRLHDGLVELRGIVQYLYSHKTKGQIDRTMFDHFDNMMASIIEECRKNELGSDA